MYTKITKYTMYGTIYRSELHDLKVIKVFISEFFVYKKYLIAFLARS